MFWNHRFESEEEQIKKVNQGKLSYNLNEEDKTASVFGNNLYLGDIVIPRSINYENQQYIVTSISKCAFKDQKSIKNISFPPDSELETIEEDAFLSSSIESISIPSHVTKICSGAFNDCRNLSKFEIPTNTELKTVGEHAFYKCPIENISLPSDIVNIRGDSFYNTRKPKINIISRKEQNAKIYDNECLIKKSDLKSDDFDIFIYSFSTRKKIIIQPFIKIISEYSFFGLLLESLYIPSSVTKIGYSSFCTCKNLKKVEFSPNSQLQVIEGLSFSNTSIQYICIPSSVINIGFCAFSSCSKLKKVEIPRISLIEKFRDAFRQTHIESIFIPPRVRKLGSNAFCSCNRLNKIEIPLNSELEEIEIDALRGSSIRSIFLPQHLKKIYQNAFAYTNALQIVEIAENSELESIDEIIQSGISNAIIMIPVDKKKNVH